MIHKLGQSFPNIGVALHPKGHGMIDKTAKNFFKLFVKYSKKGTNYKLFIKS